MSKDSTVPEQFSTLQTFPFFDTHGTPVRLKPNIELYVMADNEEMGQGMLPPTAYMYHVRNIFGAILPVR